MADSPDPDVPAMPPHAPRDAGPAAENAELDTARPITAADSTKNVAWPKLARMDDPAPAKSGWSASPSSDASPSQLGSWVIMQVCGLGLLLGGYFLGQAWAPKAKPNPARGYGPAPSEFAYRTQRIGGERALEAANQALKAEKAHDLQAARSIYEDMLKRQAPMPRAEYRLALLSLHEGDFFQAELHLNRSIKAGDAPADAYLFRASLASMRGNYTDVTAQFAAAVRVEPFDAKLCFCWGEALRREGRPAEAVLRLTQALDRPDSPAAQALYLFKLRLAKIEAGGDSAAEGELDNALVRPEPGGEWLMVAAAREILRKNDAAAAGLLQRAKNSLPVETFRTYAQDFRFQSRRTHPEIGDVLTLVPPTAPPGDQPLQDPAAWTAAEADPAGWPPFPTED